MALQRAENMGKDHALTEGRLRDLLGETLERVTGAKLRVFTVAEWLNQFVKQKQKFRANKTALRHEQVMNEFVAFLGPRASLNLAVVTSKDISDFRDLRETRGLTPATLNGDVTVLSMSWWDIQFPDDSAEWRAHQESAKRNTAKIERLLEVLQPGQSSYRLTECTPERVRKLRDQWQGNRDWWRSCTPEEQRRRTEAYLAFVRNRRS
jgi:hypothetical protein